MDRQRRHHWISPAVRISVNSVTEYKKTFEKCILDEIIQVYRNVRKNRLAGHSPEEWQMAMVIHGGTIMAILSRWAVPHKDYFHWQVKTDAVILSVWTLMSG